MVKVKPTAKVKSTKKKAAVKAVAARRATRAMKGRIVASLCSGVESQRSANGRIPRGVLQKVLDGNKQIYTWLTMDLIKKDFKKLSKNGSNNNSISFTNISDLTEESGLTYVTGALNPLPSIIGVPLEENNAIPIDLNNDLLKKVVGLRDLLSRHLERKRRRRKH
jgi:hypothetical protein